MRLGFLVLVALGVLAYGLLGPVVDVGHLHDEAHAAARAGYEQLGRLSGGNTATESVQQAVAASVANHSNIRVKSVKVSDGVVSVTLEEKVHSFMSGISALKGWFTISATESASITG
jgi:hypothetical protein